jgi:ribosome-binding factor A
MAYRVERVEKIIERELASILFDSSNNKLKFVSITKVALTSDLSLATVYYTVLGNEGEIESTKEDLEKSKGYLRSSLAKKLDLRKTPDLRFKYDESLAYGNRITQILDNLKK